MTIYQIIRNVPGDDPWPMSAHFTSLDAARTYVRQWRRSDDGKHTVRYDILRCDRDADDLPWRVTDYWIGVTP